MRQILLGTIVLASLSACTWVKLEPAAGDVRVVRMSEDLSACTKRGEVSATVRDKVSLYQRNELKVRDELETMARNEAIGLGADTLQAMNEPSAGEQRFAAYSCGRNAPISQAPTRTPRDEPTQTRPQEAQTFPVRED